MKFNSAGLRGSIFLLTALRDLGTIMLAHHRGTKYYRTNHLCSFHIYFIVPSTTLSPPTEQLGGMKDCFLPSPLCFFPCYLEK